jgi:hypothetical protein
MMETEAVSKNVEILFHIDGWAPKKNLLHFVAVRTWDYRGNRSVYVH